MAFVVLHITVYKAYKAFSLQDLLITDQAAVRCTVMHRTFLTAYLVATRTLKPGWDECNSCCVCKLGSVYVNEQTYWANPQDSELRQLSANSHLFISDKIQTNLCVYKAKFSLQLYYCAFNPQHVTCSWRMHFLPLRPHR